MFLMLFLEENMKKSEYKFESIMFRYDCLQKFLFQTVIINYYSPVNDNTIWKDDKFSIIIYYYYHETL